MDSLNYFKAFPLPPTPFVVDRKTLEILQGMAEATEKDGLERSVILCTTPDTAPVAFPTEQCVGSKCAVRVPLCANGEKPVATLHTHHPERQKLSVGDMLRVLQLGKDAVECAVTTDVLFGGLPVAKINCGVKVRDISPDKLREINQEYLEKVEPAYERAEASGEDISLTPEEEEAYVRLEKELSEYIDTVPFFTRGVSFRIGDKTRDFHLRHTTSNKPELTIVPVEEMCRRFLAEEFPRLTELAERVEDCDDVIRVSWQLGAAEELADSMNEFERWLMGKVNNGRYYPLCRRAASLTGNILTGVLNKAKKFCAGTGKG